MTDATHVREADLHRAVPRDPIGGRRFKPQRVPWSVFLLGLLSGLSSVFGVMLVFGTGLTLYFGGLPVAAVPGAPSILSVLAFMAAGVVFVVMGIIGFVAQNIAKAVLETRDLARHCSDQATGLAGGQS